MPCYPSWGLTAVLQIIQGCYTQAGMPLLTWSMACHTVCRCTWLGGKHDTLSGTHKGPCGYLVSWSYSWHTPQQLRASKAAQTALKGMQLLRQQLLASRTKAHLLSSKRG